MSNVNRPQMALPLPWSERILTDCLPAVRPGRFRMNPVTAVSMRREDTMTDWIQLIRAEYHEMPGLHLTKRQVQRLWSLDATVCDAVLEALETASVLQRTHTGAYVKARGVR